MSQGLICALPQPQLSWRSKGACGPIGSVPPAATAACQPSSALCVQINPCVIPNSLEDLGMFLYRNPPELCLLCVPEPTRTSSAICPATLRNLISFCAGTFGTLSAICARTIRNLISHLCRNPPEPCLPSAPEPAGTSSGLCAGTLGNFSSFLRRNPLEPHQLSAPEP